MYGSSVESTPVTPFPDSPSRSDDAPAPNRPSDQRAGSDVRRPVSPVSSSSDDLSVLLTQPKPDPFLDDTIAVEAMVPASAQSRRGDERPSAERPAPLATADASDASPGTAREMTALAGREPAPNPAPLSSSESVLALGIKFTPSPDPEADPRSSAPSARHAEPNLQDEPSDEALRINWPFLLVSSYASAITLGFLWFLWAGRSLPPQRAAEPVPVDAVSDPPSRTSAASPVSKVPQPLPVHNLVDLGNTLRLGDLEITPLSIVHRSVYLYRLEGATGEERESPESLVLTLRLTNRSETRVFAPLDRSFIRDPGAAEDHSYIVSPDGQRIPMFRLAAESEWSIQDQEFPELNPGETAETIVVSEPVQSARLAGRLTWRVKLRTRTYQTDVAGVRFTAGDVVDYRR
jgi:hypothetical protein